MTSDPDAPLSLPLLMTYASTPLQFTPFSGVSSQVFLAYYHSNATSRVPSPEASYFAMRDRLPLGPFLLRFIGFKLIRKR